MARTRLSKLEPSETEAVPRNILIYVRVSTDAQAQNQLSLSDQENQLLARCKRDGDQVVGIFREEGESATNMRRPAFEAMIARATDGTHSVDAILVYSFSRVFRNQVEQELTVQMLRKHHVELISHAEPLTNDDTGDLFRKFIGIVNEFQSKETSRATTRTMKENARRGYSNGGIIPFGYKSVDAELIGHKQKKRMEIEPVEAEIVRLAFRLAMEGDGRSGSMGTKKIAVWLNEHGYRTRRGSLFGTGTVHEILTREAYTGLRRFNEFDREGAKRKPTAEIIEYEIPMIIERATFDAVQKDLVARQPRSRGPRLTSAPSLLGGLVRCDCEKSYALSTATGTSRNGTIYSYYKCVQGTKRGSQCGAAGTCTNRKIARPLIEKLVVDALIDKLLTPERVNAILVALKSRRDDRQASADRRISEVAKQVVDIEERLSRIYSAIEGGSLDPSEPTLKERVASLTATRDRAAEALSYAKKSLTQFAEVDAIAIERFTRLMRDQLISGDVSARKAYLAAIVDRIIVSDSTIRIVGSHDNIRAAIGPDGRTARPVRKSVQEWCPGAERCLCHKYMEALLYFCSIFPQYQRPYPRKLALPYRSQASARVHN